MSFMPLGVSIKTKNVGTLELSSPLQVNSWCFRPVGPVKQTEINDGQKQTESLVSVD